MRELTRKQKKILDWVVAFKARHGLPPTVREIGAHFGMASSSVFDHLKLIEKKGHIRRGKLGARSLEIPGAATDGAPAGAAAPLSVLEAAGDDSESLAVPEVGRVAAGVPLLAQENVEGRVRLDRSMLRGPRGAQYFILRVTGDSMVEAGILDGDRVVVRRQDTAEDGQIVVALLEDEATVKRFYRESGRVRLEPANSRMGPIYAREVAVQGVVVCSLRTYG